MESKICHIDELLFVTVFSLEIVLSFKGMLQQNIGHFLKTLIYEKLGFCEMN